MNIRRLFATALLLCASSVALAAYPDKPIKVIVGFAAGGGSDILIRTITPGLSEVLGVPVVVDNLPGAGGNRGPTRGDRPGWSADDLPPAREPASGDRRRIQP